MRFKRKAGMGFHTFWINGAKTRVKGGETVECAAEDLGVSIKNYDRLDAKFNEPEPELPPAKMLVVVPAEEKGQWNIVNEAFPDNPLNDTPLKRREATALLRQLSGDGE